MTTNGDDGVRFTVKELLLELRGDLKAISAKLDTKADVAALNALEGKVHDLELRGSQQAREALSETHELEKVVQELKSELRDRPSQVQDFYETKTKVESNTKKLWVLSGGIAAVAAMATANTIHVWLGVG